MSVLDNMLEQTLDEVEVAPEYCDYPDGEYVLEIVKAEPKEYEAKGDRPAGVRVNVTYAVVETVELVDAKATPVDAESLNSEGFNLNQQGLPYFKRYLANIFGDTEGVSLGESIRALKGMQINCVCRTKRSGDSAFMNTSKQSEA